MQLSGQQKHSNWLQLFIIIIITFCLRSARASQGASFKNYLSQKYKEGRKALYFGIEKWAAYKIEGTEKAKIGELNDFSRIDTLFWFSTYLI